MKTYKLRKGKHSFFKIPRIIFRKKVMKVRFLFTDSCKYLLGNDDQLDWNKLIGFSRGLHHKDSIRIGWRWNHEKEKIEICDYRYISGTRVTIYIQEIELNEWNTATLEIHKGYYPFWGYVLYPYFGGNRTAPQDIFLKLEYDFE